MNHTPDDVPSVPENHKDTNPKDVVGCAKPSLAAMPMTVLYEMAAGMQDGALKYRRHNWRRAGVRASIYFDAAMRHLAAWWEGEDIDQASGVHHIGKVLSCLTVLRDAQMHGMVNDDRPPKAHDGWFDEAQANTDAVIARHPNPVPPYTEKDDPL